MATWITAHAGCDHTPDNSLESILYAQQTRADVIEVDVRRDSAGRFYLSHNPTAVPTVSLETVLDLMQNNRQGLNCDLKEPGLARPVLDLAARFKLLDRLVLSGAVMPVELRGDPEIAAHTAFNVENITPLMRDDTAGLALPGPETMTGILEECRNLGATLINIYHVILTPEILNLFETMHLAVSAWTVDDLPTAERLMAAGVYNITTRYPDQLAELRRRCFGYL